MKRLQLQFVAFSFSLFAISVQTNLGANSQHTNGQNLRDPPEALWFIDKELPEVTSNERLRELTQRVGPNMRASSDYHDFADIQANDSVAAWSALESRVRSLAQSQVNHFRPKILTLIKQANVSEACRESVQVTLKSLYQMDSWAFQSK